MDAKKIMSIFFREVLPPRKRKNIRYGWQKGKVYRNIKRFNESFPWLNLYAHYNGHKLEKVTLGEKGETIAIIKDNRYKLVEENLKFIEDPYDDQDKKLKDDAVDHLQKIIDESFAGDFDFYRKTIFE